MGIWFALGVVAGMAIPPLVWRYYWPGRVDDPESMSLSRVWQIQVWDAEIIRYRVATMFTSRVVALASRRRSNRAAVTVLLLPAAGLLCLVSLSYWPALALVASVMLAGVIADARRRWEDLQNVRARRISRGLDPLTGRRLA